MLSPRGDFHSILGPRNRINFRHRPSRPMPSPHETQELEITTTSTFYRSGPDHHFITSISRVPHRLRIFTAYIGVLRGFYYNMSFLGGAECSTAGNPLSQFTKHVQDDKSLQRDRLIARGPGGLQGMRSSGMNGSQDNVS